MLTSECKNALEKIHNNNDVYQKQEINTDRINKAKEWFTKGFEINRCYQEDWDHIKEIFREYNVDLNAHGPIITINQRKYVQKAQEITEKIKHNPELREMVNTGLYSSKHNYEKHIDGQIFIAVLRLLPEYCRKKALDQLKNTIIDEGNIGFIGEVLQLNGTIKTTDKEIDRIVDCLIQNKQ